MSTFNKNNFMKHLFPIALCFLFAACSSEAEKEVNTVFSGTISGSEIDTIRLFNDDLMLKLAVTDGSFKDTIEIEEGYYTIRIGRESSQLYFDKGFDLTLNIDTKEFDESISYSGNGSNENNALAKMYMVDELHLGNQSEFYSLDETAFINSLNELKNKLVSVLDSSQAKSAFVSEQKKGIDYQINTYLYQYENGHAYFTQNDTFKVSDDFYTSIIPYERYNETEFKRLSNYQGLNIINFSTDVRKLRADGQSSAEALNKVSGEIQSEYVKNELINNYSRFLLEPNDELEELYAFLSQNVSDTSYLKNYNEAYETNKQLLKGMPSPVFSDYENHAGGTMSLADLEGKYTYIDVWATWCGPCLREVPFLKEVESKFHDKNINFVSISVDQLEDHGTWIDMVKDKELGGIQLFADNSWQSDFVKGYGIKGIPRFILLDDEGNIVDANAPRPSNPELIEVLEEFNL